MIDLFKVSKQESSRRMDICTECELLTYKKIKNWLIPICDRCKCVMTVKTKIIGVKCPEGKW